MKSKKEKKKGKKSHKDEKKSERKIEKKAKKKAKKERKEREKKLKEQLLSVKQPHNEKEETAVKPKGKECEDDVDCGPSIELMNRARCPETKEQWDKRQSQIKRVIDPETGRCRLIKGDGEVLEEIVTKERHQQINRDATKNDGFQYQSKTIGASRKK